VGRVVDVGPDAAEAGLAFNSGDRIGVWGGHARFHTISSDDWWFPVPEGPTDAEAAFGPIAQITMNGIRQAEVEWGDTVTVFGLGLLGQFAVRLLLLAGARPVFGFDLESSRVDLLPEHPSLSGVLPSEDDNLPSLVEEENGGRLADVVVESTGVAGAIPDQFDVLRKQGRLVVLGSPRDTTEFDFYSQCHLPGHEIVGAHVGTHPEVATVNDRWTMQRHAELFFDYLADASLNVESLVSDEVSVERAPAVYAALDADRTEKMGVQFVW
jgi:threonine dehydrogenase-like Zn-dependent dehydrogenase